MRETPCVFCMWFWQHYSLPTLHRRTRLLEHILASSIQRPGPAMRFSIRGIILASVRTPTLAVCLSLAHSLTTRIMLSHKYASLAGAVSAHKYAMILVGSAGTILEYE